MFSKMTCSILVGIFLPNYLLTQNLPDQIFHEQFNHDSAVWETTYTESFEYDELDRLIFHEQIDYTGKGIGRHIDGLSEERTFFPNFVQVNPYYDVIMEDYMKGVVLYAFGEKYSTTYTYNEEGCLDEQEFKLYREGEIKHIWKAVVTSKPNCLLWHLDLYVRRDSTEFELKHRISNSWPSDQYLDHYFNYYLPNGTLVHPTGFTLIEKDSQNRVIKFDKFQGTGPNDKRHLVWDYDDKDRLIYKSSDGSFSPFYRDSLKYLENEKGAIEKIEVDRYVNNSTFPIQSHLDFSRFCDDSYKIIDLENLPVLHAERMIFKYNDPVDCSIPFQEDVFSIYPNPTNNILNIKTMDWELNNVNLKIYNLIGHLFYEETIRGKLLEYSIDVSFLAQGFYYLILENESSKSIQAFAVSR